MQTQHRSESDTATNRASRCLIGNIVLNCHHVWKSLRLCWIRDNNQNQMYTCSCYPFIELCAVSQRRSVPTTSGARDILSRPSPLSRERAASESVSVPYVDDRNKSFICGVESGYVIQVGVVMVHSINLCLKIGIQTWNWDLCFERAATCSVYIQLSKIFFS